MKLAVNKICDIMVRLFIYSLFAVVCSNAYAGGAAPDPLCIIAKDDFGDKAKSSVNVFAIGQTENNGWLQSPVELIEGGDLQIRSIGNVDLCEGKTATYINSSTASTISTWQSTGIQIKKGDTFTLKWASGSWSYVKGTTNQGFIHENGEKLFIHLAADSDSFSEDWWEVPSGWQPSESNQLGDFKEYKTFSLYNGSEGSFAYESGDRDEIDSIWGDNEYLTVYVRYVDGFNARNATPWSTTSHTNNEGSYEIEASFDADCIGDEGEFLIAWVGEKGELPDEKKIGPRSDNVINLDPYAFSGADDIPGYYVGQSPATGTLWFKILDDSSISWISGSQKGDDDYTAWSPDTATGSNKGYYSVNVIYDKEPNTSFSDVVNILVDPVRDLLQGEYDESTGQREGGLTKRMYEGITGNYDFILTIRALMALSIVFMGFHHMVGLSNITQKDLAHKMIKMAIVIMLIGPDSWKFFYDILFTFFIDGVDELIQVVSSPFLSVINVDEADSAAIALSDSGDARYDTFEFVNKTMERFFTEETGIKLQALLATFPIGFIVGLLLYLGIFLFIAAVIKSVIVYVLSIVMTALLLFMAPIFISFLLFNKTKERFDIWLKNLISFMIQPVLLLTILVVFNAIVYSAFYEILSFSVCYQCIFELDLPMSENIFQGVLGNFDKFCVMTGYLPWGIGGEQDPGSSLRNTPVGLFVGFIFIILCICLLKFTDTATSIATSLSAGALGVNLAGAQNAVISEAIKPVVTVFKETAAAITSTAENIKKVVSANKIRREAAVTAAKGGAGGGARGGLEENGGGGIKRPDGNIQESDSGTTDITADKDSSPIATENSDEPSDSTSNDTRPPLVTNLNDDGASAPAPDAPELPAVPDVGPENTSQYQAQLHNYNQTSPAAAPQPVATETREQIAQRVKKRIADAKAARVRRSGGQSQDSSGNDNNSDNG